MYTYHSLLPNYVQDELRAISKDLDKLDNYVKAVQQSMPNRFHNINTLSMRVFFDEPASSSADCPRAGFLHADKRKYRKHHGLK